MRAAVLVALLAITASSAAQDTLPTADAGPSLSQVIEQHLGRPYSWGSSGLKSFDCSGFVWRVMADHGVLIKRTTARKLYVSLPKVEDGHEREFGTLVFFDNLGHCGIVNDGTTFYHAQCSKGTNLSPFAPYWQKLVCGYRTMPKR